MDYEAARANMIEQQIRPWNVLEMQTLKALGSLRREDFVPNASRELAFTDVQIPLGDGEVMLEPKVSARMLESLHLNRDDNVLEIGTGTGYLTALLCLVAKHVTSVEINPQLLAQAERNLGMAGISNFTLVSADAHNGWHPNGEGGLSQFDAILISGSLNRVPDSFKDQLLDGGRMVCIEGQKPAMQAVLYTKSGTEKVRRTLFETWAPRLKNAEDKEEFVF
ncbi:MAG: protein-L-isoaspartate O-methyltransferase family protein [bacterium]